MIWKPHIIGNINCQKWYFVAICNLKLTVIAYFSFTKITKLYKIYSVVTHFENNSKCVKFRTSLMFVKFWTP